MGLRSRRAVVVAPAFFLLILSGTVLGQDFSGKIQIEPPFMQAKTIQVKKKVQDSCADEQLSKSLIVSENGEVANVVVWLEGNFASPIPSQQSETKAILDQKYCHFEPHVVLVPPQSRLKILNSDPLTHDVRAFDHSSMLFRIDMPTNHKPEERSFDKPGIYTIRCGLHPWMHAFVVKAAHSYYAISDEEGHFRIKNLPAGNYPLHIWHELLGETVVPIEITKSKEDFVYTFKNTLK